MKKIFFLVVLLLIVCSSFSQKTINKLDSDSNNLPKSLTKPKSEENSIHCKIKGKLNGGKSKYLMLVNQREDPFRNGIKIPIVDGHFDYELKSSYPEKYTLILSEELENGAFRAIDFFAENGVVDFNLHSTQEFDKNTIVGGKLTNKMLAFKKEQRQLFDPLEKPFSKEIDSLWDSNNYHSETVNSLFEKIKNLESLEERNKLYRTRDELLKTDKGFTPRAWFLINKIDSIQKIKYKWEAKYIKSNQDIFSYSLLLYEVTWYKQNQKNIDINVLIDLFAIYAKKFPSHSYTIQIQEKLEAIKTIKVGGMFIDFSANSIEGETIQASEIINGKVALIDLWSSWCGPCRQSSMSFIPVYEKYKDKGFVVLSVANEAKNINAFKKAIQQDNYPWLSFIDLDNKNEIWNKYNISGSGGSSYLVDSKGVILAVHPNSEELEKIVGDLLK